MFIGEEKQQKNLYNNVVMRYHAFKDNNRKLFIYFILFYLFSELEGILYLKIFL